MTAFDYFAEQVEKLPLDEPLTTMDLRKMVYIAQTKDKFHYWIGGMTEHTAECYPWPEGAVEAFKL
jgi:hypothetical protein